MYGQMQVQLQSCPSDVDPMLGPKIRRRTDEVSVLLGVRLSTAFGGGGIG